MNLLEQIVANKQKEVADKKAYYPTKLLEQTIHFNAPVVSLKKYLLREDKSGVIAEIKRKSPSKGFINKYVSVEKTSIGYMQAGASALSVLTDEQYFSGSNEDLLTARRFNYCPILRKDFIVDEYQLIEARSIGADAILLIAAVLTATEVLQLAKLAKSLQMEVLLEIHGEEELDTLNEYIDVVGVNNRDLKSFNIDLNHSIRLGKKIPSEFVKVSESGIDDPADALMLKQYGYNGFLIGSSFMKHSRPEEACAAFIQQYRKLCHEN